MTIQEKKRRINLAAGRSRIAPKVDLILGGEDEPNREFYRFSAGLLVEYELTKFNGHSISLTKEEREAADQFSCPLLEGLKL